MYCVECGSQACGRFCQHCGCRIQNAGDSPEPADFMDEQGVNWHGESRYGSIVRVEAVRKAISRSAADARSTLSGEAFLELCDKILESPVPLVKLAAFVQPIYESWGIRTGKQCYEVMSEPVGLLIAGTLCAFARNSQPFKSAEQSASGCRLHAELPSSICSFKGQIEVELQRVDQLQTAVTATTNIPGQIYDWGKSDRCLRQFFSDLDRSLDMLKGRQRPHAA